MIYYYIATIIAIALILVLLQLQYNNGYKKGFMEGGQNYQNKIEETLVKDRESKDKKEMRRVLDNVFKTKKLK